MSKTKWSNFFGDVFAAGTLTAVAISTGHVAKKYGQKFSGFSINKWYLTDYAFNKFLGDGTNLDGSIKNFISNVKGK